MHDGVHVCLRLCYRHARLQTRHHCQVMTTTIRPVLLIESDRDPQPHVLREKLKTRRHHTDNCVLLAVEQNRAIEDVAIAAVATLPEAVAEHDDFVRPRPVFFIQKAATEKWLHAEQREEICIDCIRGPALRLTVTGEIETIFV